MSDIIFKTNGEETFRIPSPFSNNYYHLPKCPETKLEVKEMTEFQPKPQHPEEVADGLRNAFRQAIKDGVMDATPYLKQMTDEQLLNSLQGTMATIDPYSVKKEAIDEYRIDTIEERLTRIEDKVDLLISQLKIEFYKKNDGTSR
jgi:hypothetical protein